MLELATLTARHAHFRPDAQAVSFGDETLTYAQFGSRVARSANLLRSLGIGRGDKVATVLGNSREALELVWAVPAIGAALVPLSPLLMPAGLAGLLRDSDAKCLVSQRSMLETLKEIRVDLAPLLPGRVLLVDGSSNDFEDYGELTAAQDDAVLPEPCGPDDLFNIMYTSGTTGMPKGIMHSHEEIAAQHPAIREVAVFGVPHDKWGETPLAAVILREGTQTDAGELRDWINQRVGARYQRVSEVVILEDFPRNAAGKTLKREMREPYWAGRNRKI